MPGLSCPVYHAAVHGGTVLLCDGVQLQALCLQHASVMWAQRVGLPQKVSMLRAVGGRLIIGGLNLLRCYDLFPDGARLAHELGNLAGFLPLAVCRSGDCYLVATADCKLYRVSLEFALMGPPAPLPHRQTLFAAEFHQDRLFLATSGAQVVCVDVSGGRAARLRVPSFPVHCTRCDGDALVVAAHKQVFQYKLTSFGGVEGQCPSVSPEGQRQSNSRIWCADSECFGNENGEIVFYGRGSTTLRFSESPVRQLLKCEGGRRLAVYSDGTVVLLDTARLFAQTRRQASIREAHETQHATRGLSIDGLSVKTLRGNYIQTSAAPYPQHLGRFSANCAFAVLDNHLMLVDPSLDVARQLLQLAIYWVLASTGAMRFCLLGRCVLHTDATQIKTLCQAAERIGGCITLCLNGQHVVAIPFDIGFFTLVQEQQTAAKEQNDVAALGQQLVTASEDGYLNFIESSTLLLTRRIRALTPLKLVTGFRDGVVFAGCINELVYLGPGDTRAIRSVYVRGTVNYRFTCAHQHCGQVLFLFDSMGYLSAFGIDNGDFVLYEQIYVDQVVFAACTVCMDGSVLQVAFGGTQRCGVMSVDLSALCRMRDGVHMGHYRISMREARQSVTVVKKYGLSSSIAGVRYAPLAKEYGCCTWLGAVGCYVLAGFDSGVFAALTHNMSHVYTVLHSQTGVLACVAFQRTGREYVAAVGWDRVVVCYGVVAADRCLKLTQAGSKSVCVYQIHRLLADPDRDSLIVVGNGCTHVQLGELLGLRPHPAYAGGAGSGLHFAEEVRDAVGEDKALLWKH